MSIRLRYQLTLVEPISLRVAPGRGGNTFIPGANILGAVAARGGYARAQELGLEWDIFHSGAISFGDARQLDERAQSPVIATPLSVHQPKQSVGGDYRDLTLIPPAARFKRDENPTQLVQTRGVIGASGRTPQLKSGYTLKTAIDVKSQRADDGKLFGHSYIASGAELGCAILIDDAHPRAAELAEFVKRALTQGLRLGKSRSAEFGEVHATLIEEATQSWSESEPSLSNATLRRRPHPEKSGREMVSYLLLSDACLADHTSGEPTLNINAAHFGLDSSRFYVEPDYTFTRAARWRQFNGHRRRPDMERVALVAGSVITVSASLADWDALDTQTHLSALNSGLGAYTAEGLGRVSATHPFVGDDAELNKRYAASAVSNETTPSEHKLPAPPSDELGRWIASRYESSLYEEVALTLARELTQRSQDKTMSVSEGIWGYRFDQLLKGGSGRPTSSQWREVEHKARKILHKTNGLSHLRAHLIESNDALLVRGKAKDVWRLESGVSGEAPSQSECRRTPGLCVVAILSNDLYYRDGESTSDWFDQLEEATTLRLQATRSAVTKEGVQKLVVDRLAPLTLVHFARAVARKIQA